MTNKSYKLANKNGLEYVALELLAHPGITHAFSTRKGGVSQGSFSSLNLNMAVGDEVEAVEQNRRLFCQALGVNPEKLVTMKQIHSDTINSFAKKPTEIPIGDAIITNQPGLTLAVQTADCVPILIADTVNKIIAAVHAGWRGTAANILGKTLGQMVRLGACAQSCIVGIGPSIGACCYEVDDQVINQFRSRRLPWEEFIRSKSNGRWWLDLADMNEWQAKDAGVLSENIAKVGMCTNCEEELFFSYRRDKQTGRMMSVIALAE